MLVEIAIGDSYGAAFEYADPVMVKVLNDLSGYRQHPTHKEIKPGCYTDDTQMCLALANLMLCQKKPRQWTPKDIAHAFLTRFKNDRRTGYAGGFFKFLDQTSSAEQFLANIRPSSQKSGGAMRAPVIGLFPDPTVVVDTAMFQASITHATQIGTTSAAVAALLVHYFWHRKGPKSEVVDFINQWVPASHGNWGTPYRGSVGSFGWMPVHAAISAIMENNTMSGVLRASVAYTGDVDTSAAIALAAASVCDEIIQDLPDVLFQTLESGKNGMPLLVKADELLEEKFPRPAAVAGKLEEWDEEEEVTWSPSLWHCTDCGEEVTFTEDSEPDPGQFLNCPCCGGYESLSVVGGIEPVPEPEEDFDWLV